MGALSFTSPLLLFGLLALPAIWFLLRATPPSPRTVRFPPFEILRRLSKTPETPERTPWWVLLLRLAIAGLAILGLAGPILNSPPAPTSAGPLIIVVDDSWAAAPGWKKRRDAMANAAEQSARAGRQAYVIETASEATEAPEPITGEELADAGASLEPKPHLPDYARARARAAALAGRIGGAEILWLSDGVAHQGSAELYRELTKLGDVSVRVDDAAPAIALFPPTRDDAGLNYHIEAIGSTPWRGDLVGLARDGRELARTTFEVGGGGSGDATIDLPLALQNDLAQARLEGVPSAGAVQLVDARDRRALIGFISSGREGADPLLSGAHYVKKALAPYALFVTDTLENLIASEASVIVLDDVGVLRPSDVDDLQEWVEKGGVIIRFAGPTLAEAAAERKPPLLPVELRGGGRAFGGALTWESPQPLGGFSFDGPFSTLTPPADVFVRRQVLAEPGGETPLRTWASLKDGTPLVTGASDGAGAIALFHVTATPDWSDLPLSSTFVEMLRKLVFLSALGPKAQDDRQAQRAAPFRVLDGFGVLTQPSRDIGASSVDELGDGPAPGRPPGLYGAPEAPIAVNAVRPGDAFKAFNIQGVSVEPYFSAAPVRIGPPLIAIALLFLIADGLVALRFAGKLPFLAALAAAIAGVGADRTSAEPLDRPVSPSVIEGALAFRLAYVKTGDPATDRIAEAGLSGLTRELTRRTSAEPAPPIGVNPETDDLSVYPFLYWPITPGASAPSEQALANIENFMRFGGLVVFDTRDDERAVDGVDTPESLALKALLADIDLPPLAPVPPDHVLNRSFYLLSDLPGRAATRPVWVQSGDGPNDSVTPVVIGGRDWAGAWAANAVGEPLLPTSSSARPCANVEGAVLRSLRECSYRAGVNMVMVALTGNYKSDQVHTPILLERLGRE
jgi:hypothetical protein